MRDSLTGLDDIRQTIHSELGFDSDHEDGEVVSIDFDVTDVEEVEG